MKVRGLDDRQYTWRLVNHQVEEGSTRPRSSLHLRARQILKGMFQFAPVLEEVHLPGCPESLYVDFYIPAARLGIEVQGEQHFKFVPLFHGSRHNFFRSKVRDQRKRDWFSLNDLTLVALPYNEDDDVWRKRIAAEDDQGTVG